MPYRVSHVLFNHFFPFSPMTRGNLSLFTCFVHPKKEKERGRERKLRKEGILKLIIIVSQEREPLFLSSLTSIIRESTAFKLPFSKQSLFNSSMCHKGTCKKKEREEEKNIQHLHPSFQLIIFRSKRSTLVCPPLSQVFTVYTNEITSANECLENMATPRRRGRRNAVG